MGASIGVVDSMNAELKEIVEMTEKIKFTIAEYDSALIDRENAKVFKKHGKIIKALTSRTKAQNLRTITMKKKTPDDIYQIVGGNNNYAKFMKMLFMSKQDIEMENLKATGKADLYDEEMLVNIIGTSSAKEVKELDELFKKEKETTLAQMFESKTKEGSHLQKFVALCLEEGAKRPITKSADDDLAIKQANEIHKAGASRLLGQDEDVIFNILVNASRAQCASIADAYLTLHHMKFERAINMKFKGNCGKLILLWSQTLPAAVVSCLSGYQERMIVDKIAVVSMIAKYDKDFLAQVDISAEKLFEKNLIGVVQRGLSGNLLKAVTEWIENATPDKGYERVMKQFLDTQTDQGRSLEDMMYTDEFQQRLIFLQTKEKDELQKYVKENRIKFNPEDKLDLRALSMDSFAMHHNQAALDDAPVESLNKYSVKSVTPVNGASYDKKFQLVQNYLQNFFEKYDPQEEGHFETERFWELMKELPMTAMGFSPEALDDMRNWTEWDMDGCVYYHEAMYELSDSAITAIEGKTTGNTDVESVIFGFTDSDKMHKAKSQKRVTRNQSLKRISSIPDYFLQYLYDTFYAFDFDQNGYLCTDELTNVLPVINIGLTNGDFIFNETDTISHVDAVKIIAEHVEPWFEDQSEDHFMCLVDKDSGAYFWYNSRDESTQWADDSAQGTAQHDSRKSSVVDSDALQFANALKEAALTVSPRAEGIPSGGIASGGIAAEDDTKGDVAEPAPAADEKEAEIKADEKPTPAAADEKEAEAKADANIEQAEVEVEAVAPPRSPRAADEKETEAKNAADDKAAGALAAEGGGSEETPAE